MIGGRNDFNQPGKIYIKTYEYIINIATDQADVTQLVFY